MVMTNGTYQNGSSLFPILKTLQKRKNVKPIYKGKKKIKPSVVIEYMTIEMITRLAIKIESVRLKRKPGSFWDLNVSHLIDQLFVSVEM